MANIIFGDGINKAFTEVVNGYMASGMVLHVGTMAGHQGEIAKVDLTDGTDVYRIWMNREHECGFEFCGDIIVITVEKFAGKANLKSIGNDDTLWGGQGEVIGSEMKWYSVSGRWKNETFTDSREFAIECQKKHNDRYHNRNNGTFSGEKEIKMDTEAKRNFVRDMCRTHRGYGRVKRAEMKKLVKFQMSSGRTGYKVYFNNGKDALVIKSSKM